jgi:beta-glucosidase
MKQSIDNILKELTFEEKCRLLTGSAALSSAAIERLCVPSLNMSDGPHGARRLIGHPTCPQECHIEGGDTCFPTASAVGSSWNRKTAYDAGRAIALDCIMEDIQMLLAPAVNMKRTPHCGRNFEYYSEDPYLAGILGAEFINGVESRGIGTSLKHFAANNQEIDRGTINAEIDERTLREYYLKPFEIVIENSNPASVMCSYNKLNGIWASENRWLLTEILKEEWGYDGLVVSDWGAVHNVANAIRAGLDLHMPRNAKIEEQVRDGIEKGIITEQDLNRAIKAILKFLEKYAKKQEKPADYSRQKQHEAAYEAACETITLLRNDKNILPINKEKIKKIAVLGRCAEQPLFMGGGSSHVSILDESVDIPLDFIKKNAGEDIQVDYFPVFEDGFNDEGVLRAVWAGCGKYDCAVMFIGDNYGTDCETESFDRDNLKLPNYINAAVQAAMKAFGDKLVLVLQTGGPVIPYLWKDVPCVIQMWYSGEAAGRAVADILFGKVNPSGKLSETFPLREREGLEYPGDGVKCEYLEKQNVGYRYYDAHPQEVWFPFGHGISYTEFQYSDLVLSENKITSNVFSLEVSFKLKNIGEVAGKEAVQLYIAPLDAIVARPIKELRAFDKIELKAGEEKNVSFTLTDKDFAYYNVCLHDRHVESGAYRVMIGASCTDIRLSSTLSVLYDGDYTKDKFDGSMVL